MIELGKISEETKGPFSAYIEDIYGARSIFPPAESNLLTESGEEQPPE